MPTKPTKEQMTLAHVLGWSVELLRAANTVTNDTIAINTNLENINRAANVIQLKDSHRYETNISFASVHSYVRNNSLYLQTLY